MKNKAYLVISLVIIGMISIILSVSAFVADKELVASDELAIVEVGETKISQKELLLFMQERAMNCEAIDTVDAAYRFVAYKQAEASLVGTESELTDDYKETVILNNLESFEIDKEKNIEYYSSLGLTKEEGLELLNLSYINGIIASRHIPLVLDEMAAFYEKKYRIPFELNDEIINIYDEYILERVKDFTYNELKPNELPVIREEAAELLDNSIEIQRDTLK